LIIPHHIEIVNNYVHDIPGGGIATDEADYITIEGNKVHDTASGIFANSGISIFHNHNTDEDVSTYKNIIRNNISYRNIPKTKWILSKKWSDGNGIIVDDFRNTQKTKMDRYINYLGKTLIENNLTYENSGSGIHAYSADNIDIFNNTAYNNNSEFLNWGQIFVQDSDNSRIVNNILFAKTGNIATPNYTKTNKNIIYKNNIFYNGIVNDGKDDPTNIVVDPVFVDVKTFDFSLQKTSPAVDKGVKTIQGGAIPQKDIKGIIRPQGVGIDIGAFELSVSNLKTTGSKVINGKK